MGSDELFTGSASNSGFGSAALNGEYIVHEYGATGNGTTDDTAAIQATVMAAQALGGTVVFPPGTYRITATINVTNHCTILGRGGVIHPNIPDTNAGQVFYVSGSYVTFQSLKFDYLGLQTGCEGNRYCIFAAGASNSARISNLVVRNCTFTNIETGNFPAATVGCTAVWVQWTDFALIEDCYISKVSAFGIFTEAASYVTIRNNNLVNTGWCSINSNSGDDWWLCEGNSVTGTDVHNRDEGGSIALDGTVSDGYGPTINSVIRNNYISGSVAYGQGVRLGSVQNCEVCGNVFDQLHSGTSQVGGGFGPGVISADTRGSQPYACRNVRIHHNVLIAAQSSLISSSSGIVGITFENADWSGIGRPGRAGPVAISDNQFVAANQAQAFTQAVLVHGQGGGIDGVDIHDNQGQGWCLHTAGIAAFATVIASGGTNGTVTDVHEHHNRWEIANAVHGTVSVANGSASIAFSQAQSLVSGTTITFASQPGSFYTLSGSVRGTSGTLSGNYTGTTNTATTSTVTNADQIGAYLGQYVQGAAIQHNIVTSWHVPYLLTGSGQTNIELLDSSLGILTLVGALGGQGTPLQFTLQGNIVLSHGGTLTLSSSLAQTPNLAFTDSGLTSNAIVVFPTTTGPTEWIIDMTGVSYGIYSITLAVGTKTKTVTLTSASATIVRVHSDGMGSITTLSYS